LEAAVLRIVLTRILLAALPFAVYFVWREWARRTGRPMGSTPWGWLVAAGALLVAVSLFATVLFRPDNRAQDYRPAEAHPGGKITPGGFK
jgi:type VI protein secretion system component VasK